MTIGRTAGHRPLRRSCGLTALFLPVMVKALSANPPWQFIHEDDLAELVVLLLKNKKCGIYNLVADGVLSYREMIKQIGRPSVTLPSWLLYWGTQLSWLLRLQARSQPGALALLKYPIILSNDKVKSETGYQFRYTAPEALNSFLRSFRSHSTFPT